MTGGTGGSAAGDAAGNPGDGSGGQATSGSGGNTGGNGAGATGGVQDASGECPGDGTDQYTMPAQAPTDEDGSQLWMRYVKVSLPCRLAEYQAALTHVVKAGTSDTLQAAQAELVTGLGGLLGTTVSVSDQPTGDGALVLGTSESSAIVKSLPLVELANGKVIRYDVSLKSPFFTQYILQKPRVGMGRNSIYFIIGSHNADCSALVNRSFKWVKKNFAKDTR